MARLAASTPPPPKSDGITDVMDTRHRASSAAAGSQPTSKWPIFDHPQHRTTGPSQKSGARRTQGGAPWRKWRQVPPGRALGSLTGSYVFHAESVRFSQTAMDDAAGSQGQKCPERPVAATSSHSGPRGGTPAATMPHEPPPPALVGFGPASAKAHGPRNRRAPVTESETPQMPQKHDVGQQKRRKREEAARAGAAPASRPRPKDS